MRRAAERLPELLAESSARPQPPGEIEEGIVAVDRDAMERQAVIVGAGAPGPRRARRDVARLGGGGLYGLVEGAVGVGQVDNGLAQECHAFWEKDTKKWSWE